MWLGGLLHSSWGPNAACMMTVACCAVPGGHPHHPGAGRLWGAGRSAARRRMSAPQRSMQPRCRAMRQLWEELAASQALQSMETGAQVPAVHIAISAGMGHRHCH
jgi:hypothetical protein